MWSKNVNQENVNQNYVNPEIIINIFKVFLMSFINVTYYYFNHILKNNYKCDCGCREVANILYGSPKETDTSIITREME